MERHWGRGLGWRGGVGAWARAVALGMLTYLEEEGETQWP